MPRTVTSPRVSSKSSYAKKGVRLIAQCRALKYRLIRQLEDGSLQRTPKTISQLRKIEDLELDLMEKYGRYLPTRELY